MLASRDTWRTPCHIQIKNVLSRGYHAGTLASAALRCLPPLPPPCSPGPAPAPALTRSGSACSYACAQVAHRASAPRPDHEALCRQVDVNKEYEIVDDQSINRPCIAARPTRRTRRFAIAPASRTQRRWCARPAPIPNPCHTTNVDLDSNVDFLAVRSSIFARARGQSSGFRR